MNKVAVALAEPTTEHALAELDRLAPLICAAEVRLDLMQEFDIDALVGKSPVPLVITLRPTREGGKYSGSEDQRLDTLRRAVELGAAYIDIEHDAVEAVTDWPKGNTKVIVSRHWFDSMPEDLHATYETLRASADIVKLVGTASSLVDIAPVLRLLRTATSPVIVLAMDEPGQLTRAISPAFPECEMTYGAASTDALTAPGQMTVAQMVDEFRLDALTPESPIEIAMTSEGFDITRNDDCFAVRLPVANEEADLVGRMLEQELPQATISWDYL